MTCHIQNLSSVIPLWETLNTNKMKKLIYSKSKAKWWFFLAILGIVLTFTACDQDGLEEFPPEPETENTSIKLVNQLSESYYNITSVKLVGYEFGYLSIPKGDSKTFILDKGIPGGYEDVNVIVRYSSSHVSRSKSAKVNFNEGGVTTITLTGRSGCEGCEGHRLEWK